MCSQEVVFSDQIMQPVASNKREASVAFEEPYESTSSFYLSTDWKVYPFFYLEKCALLIGFVHSWNNKTCTTTIMM